MAYLLIPDRKSTRKVSIKKNPFFIGRARENDLIVPSESLSRFHAQITRNGETFSISDRGSLNGVFVNGTRIYEEKRLHDGDVIGFGSIHVRFFLEKELSVLETKTVDKVQRFPISKLMDSRQFKPEKRERYLELLYKFSARLLQQFPSSDLGDVALDLVQEVWNPDRSCLMVRELSGEWQIATQRFGKNPEITGENLEISTSLIRELEKNEEALLISQLLQDKRFNAAESLHRQHVNSVMCAPLWANRKIHGFIYTDLLFSTRDFSYEDLEMFVILANLAAMKYENDSLWHQALLQQQLEQELNLAAEIQKKFFPVTPPKLDTYEFGAISIPTRKVGGDSYFWHEKQDGTLVLMVADVMGKGLPSALLMSQLQAIMKIFSEQFNEAKDITQAVNEFIYKHSTQEKFISMIVINLVPETGEMTFSNAGHNPPFLITEDGPIQYLEEGGMPVGVFLKQDYSQGKGRIKPGDILVLYTDGLVEARNSDDEEFGLENLVKHIKENGKLSAAPLTAHTIRKIREEWLSTDQEDDWTMLIVKRLATEH